MQYKLIENSANDIKDVLKTILLNRGIRNPEEYVDFTKEDICNWHDLDNIDQAVGCFVKHFERGDDIAVLVDSDP